MDLKEEKKKKKINSYSKETQQPKFLVRSGYREDLGILL